MAKLTLIRGLPGSGKTTLAEALVEQARRDGRVLHHVETDKLFVGTDGVYRFRKEWLERFREHCRTTVWGFMAVDANVVVSATFVTRAYMQPYLDMVASWPGYDVEIITCRGNYENVHGCTPELIRRLRDKWEEL